MKQVIVDIQNKKVGEFELNDAVFAVEPNKALIFDNVQMQRASRRAGTHSVRTVSTISGTTAKIYRQKGTGNARHGSMKRNIFVGGAPAFGPQPRDYAYKLPKKVRKAGLISTLSLKREEGKFLVVQDWNLKEIKTKKMIDAMKKLGVASALFVIEGQNENFVKSVRNIPHTKVLKAEGVNVYDLLRYDFVVFTQAAVAKVQEALV